METLNFNGIEWEVLDTPIAKRYSEFLKDRIDTKQFFYMGETKTQIKDEIEKIAYMKGAPTMDLNELHEYFADHEEDEDLQRLNHLIHYYELVDNNYPPRWGLEPTNDYIGLLEEDFDQFTLTRQYGYLYIGYPHVGKHFAEIVFSNDVDIKEEQYHPQEICRTNFFCWLGKEISSPPVTFWNKAQKVHKQVKDRLNLPEMDDPALRMGYIPFAKLKTRINSNELVSHLLKVKQGSTNYTELFNG